MPEIPYLRPARARFPRDGDITAIVGVKGCGKTTLLYRSLAWDVCADHRQVVAFDGSGDLMKYIATGGPWGKRYIPPKWCTKVGNGRDAREALEQGFRVVSFDASIAELDGLVKDFLDLIDSEAMRGKVVAADEVEMLFPNRLTLEGNAFRAIKLARNRQVRFYGCGQRPQYINSLFRQNTDFACVFRADSQLYVKGCQEWGDPDRFEPALSLEKFHFLYREPWSDPLAPLPVLNAMTVPVLPWRD